MGSATTRKRYQLDDNEIALLGQPANKQKNHAFIVQILASLRKFRLLIAGSEPGESLRMEASRMGVSERVQRTLSEAEIRALLKLLMSLCLLPSMKVRAALAETMSAGKAIVASDIPSNRETLIGDQIEAVSFCQQEPDRWTTTLTESVRVSQSDMRLENWQNQS